MKVKLEEPGQPGRSVQPIDSAVRAQVPVNVASRYHHTRCSTHNPCATPDRINGESMDWVWGKEGGGLWLTAAASYVYWSLRNRGPRADASVCLGVWVRSTGRTLFWRKPAYRKSSWRWTWEDVATGKHSTLPVDADNQRDNLQFLDIEHA